MRTFRIGQWQGGPCSFPMCASSPTESFSCLREETSNCLSILLWVSRHLHMNLKDISKQKFATKSMLCCIPVMAHFHNGLWSLLLHNYKHSISCSIWETQKTAKECSIFISIHDSTINPSVIWPAETALKIDLSCKWIIPTLHFVLHVGRVLCYDSIRN